MLVIYISLLTDITAPLMDTTVCSGSEVTIRCEYLAFPRLTITWIINGVVLDSLLAEERSRYQETGGYNMSTITGYQLLTVSNITSVTVFHCQTPTAPPTNSTPRTVRVAGIL